MKKLDRSQTRTFGPIRVLPNDLVIISDILKDRESYRLLADHHEFDSVDEFTSYYKGKRAKRITIESRSPYVTVELTPLEARVNVSTSDIEGSGLLTQISSVLSKCELRPKFLYQFWALLLLSFISNVAFLAPSNSLPSSVFFLLLALFVVWIGWVTYVHTYRHSIIETIEGDEPAFFRRKKDDIAVALISALLGAIIGAAATRATDQLWPGSSKTGQAPRSDNSVRR